MKTLSRRQILRESRRAQKEGDWALPAAAIAHPRTRGECAGGPRPCPLVGCRYHLYLDIDEDNGSIKINRPETAVWDAQASCALDEAERGGLTFEEIADALGVTHERVRQIESDALLRIAEAIGADPEAPNTDLQACFARAHSVKPDEVLTALGLNQEDSWLKNLLNSHLSTNHDDEPWLTSMTDSA